MVPARVNRNQDAVQLHLKPTKLGTPLRIWTSVLRTRYEMPSTDLGYAGTRLALLLHRTTRLPRYYAASLVALPTGTSPYGPIRIYYGSSGTDSGRTAILPGPRNTDCRVSSRNRYREILRSTRYIYLLRYAWY